MLLTVFFSVWSVRNLFAILNYKLFHMIRALLAVDGCVQMRVFKHGYDKENFIEDTEDIFSRLHPRKLCFSGLDKFPVELSQPSPSPIVLRRSYEKEEKVLCCLISSQLRSNT